jgi:hypothetical protein
MSLVSNTTMQPTDSNNSSKDICNIVICFSEACKQAQGLANDHCEAID